MAQILIAEDDEQVRTLLAETLKSIGHSVIEVGDGVKAFKALESHPCDLAIIDIYMPRMDGYHLVTKIHGLPKKPKIIIMSARKYESERNILDRIGAEAFLPKPFSHKDLVSAVNRTLNTK